MRMYRALLERIGLSRGWRGTTPPLQKADPLAIPPVCVDRERGFLFVHIPKNAGSSITQALGFTKTTHHTALQLRQLLGNEFKDLFKFAVARNPWARFLSLYRYARMPESDYHSALHPERARYGKHRDYDILQGASLRDCARLLIAGELRHDEYWNQWTPQSAWILDESGRLLLDHVGRVESLSDSIELLARKIGLPRPTIGRANSSGASEVSYRDFFDSESRSIVAEYYRSDIELLGYEF